MLLLAAVLSLMLSGCGQGSKPSEPSGPNDYLPSPDEFVPVDVYPEMIYKAPADRVRFCGDSFARGTVHVAVLLDEQGSVLIPLVRRSSGTECLDQAALDAARKCRFRPAIQNGRPIKIWVTFPYVFE